MDLGKSLLAFYLAPLKPSWWGLLELGQRDRREGLFESRGRVAGSGVIVARLP